jgi:hypothetical protein
VASGSAALARGTPRRCCRPGISGGNPQARRGMRARAPPRSLPPRMSWMRAMTRWSAGAAQQDRSLAKPDRAFELDRGVGGGDPPRAGHPGAPVIDLFIMRGADEQHAFRLGQCFVTKTGTRFSRKRRSKSALWAMTSTARPSRSSTVRSSMRCPATISSVMPVDLPPEKWTPGYAYFASACCGVM